MNSSKYILVLALGLALAAACGDDDGGGASVESLCQKRCTLVAGLSCPNETAATCQSECEQVADAVPPACLPQAKAGLQCAVNRPASDWECDASGDADIKSGVCDAETSAVVSCVFGNEDGTCPTEFENDGECDDPTGTDLCPAGTDVADCT